MRNGSSILPWRRRAKCDGIIGAGASESAGGVIVGVAIRSRTSRFEYLRVFRRLTGRRWTIRATTAVFRRPKLLTRASTRAAVSRLKLRWTLPIQVRHAPGRPTCAGSTGPLDDHRQIVPVDKTDIVEIRRSAGPKSELRQSRRWGSSGAVTLNFAGPTIPCNTGTTASAIKAAPGSAPEAAGPATRRLKRPWTSLSKLETSGVKLQAAGAGENSGPNCKIALVDKCKFSSKSS